MNAEILRRVQNIFLGVRIGDALGMPVETLTQAEIVSVLGPKGVTEYMAPVQSRIHSSESFEAGNSTDDWQLTGCNIASFIESGDYDPRRFAIDHVMSMTQSGAGWGGTTREGLTEIQEYFESGGKKGRHYLVPAVCGENRGGGNGVAMQIAPFALFYHLRQKGFCREPLMSSVLSLGQMTHSEPAALIAPYVLAVAISSLIEGWGTGPFLKLLIAEHDAAALRLGSSLNNDVRTKLVKIMIAACTRDLDSKLLDPSWPRYECGTGVLASESVLYAIAKFLQQRKNFEQGVLQAVNDGGDTDSTASMVGALIAADGATIPEWMLNYPNQTEEDNPETIRRAAEVFYNVAFGT